MDAWEEQWAPYDEATYEFVLSQVRGEDVVLDIGAGDLRLARRMVQRVQKVCALEIQSALVKNVLLPVNLEVIYADARTVPFPAEITVAVLLMRHCTHFAHYWDKLTAVGCQFLITNARWRVGVERIDLNAIRRPFSQATMGWFACCCGATGFVEGPPEELTLRELNTLQEVRSCPKCERNIMLDTNFTNGHEFTNE
jgi:hypothetical protein